MNDIIRKGNIRIVKAVIAFVVIATAAILFECQSTWMVIRKSADRSTTLLLNQVENVIKNNAAEQDGHTDEMKETYISYAQTIAYILSEDPDLIDNTDELASIAEFQGVDEIHIFDETGTIIAGTVPDYYGFTFESGEQMAYFKPMLSDRTLSMCQDITPNTAEGKSMMYAITWNREGTFMVQVGIEPLRLLSELEQNSIGNVINDIPLTEGFNIYAVDRETMEIMATTNENVLPDVDVTSFAGKVGTAETGSGMIHYKGVPYYCNYRVIDGYIIAVAYNMQTSTKSIISSVSFTAGYVGLAGLVLLFVFIRLVHTDEERFRHLHDIEEYGRIMSDAGFGMWHIILKDGAAPRMQANEKMRILLGVSGQDLSEEEMYDAWYGRITPGALPSVQASVGEMLAGSFSENTYLWNHPEKGDIYIRCGGTAEKQPDGSTILAGYHADVTDIVLERETQRKKLEDTLSDYEEDESIIRSAGYGIWSCPIDEDGYVCGMTGNEKWREIFDITDADISREECLRVFREGLVNETDDLCRFDYSDLDPTIVVRLTFPWRHPRKGIIYVEIAGAKHIDPDGSLSVSGYAADVTDETAAKQKYEQELLTAREKAEAANRAKTAFLFNMSHDIRTPMNAIIGYAELLEKHGGDAEKRTDYIAKIRSSSSFLLSLINNVLELARIESGREKLSETEYAAGSLLRDIENIFSDLMEKKGIAFTVSRDTHTPQLLGDVTKVKEILLNLLSNAYKYTPAGGSVELTAEELPGKKPGYVTMRATVRDTGIGMSKDYLPHLFEQFSRERTSTESGMQGTGLGMAIVKELIEMMDGTITVDSEPGVGTTFVVEIAQRIAEKTPVRETEENAPAEPVDFEGKRILLAEDNDLNAEIAEEILGELGFKVERAEDGAVCVEKLKAADAGYYDIILMDIQMPNLNGYEAARTIRAMDDPARSGIPILAMTANAFDSDKEDAFAAGMNGHIAKPIDVNVLIRALADNLQKKTD